MSTSRNADIIIVGGGVIGTATAYYLAKYGAKNVVLIERNAIASGGTGKSCAIVRTHYSIEANLHHAAESLKIFSDFDEIVGGDPGFVRTGYLIVGPESHREPMLAVFAKQNELGIDTAEMTPAEASAVHPLISFHDAGVIGFDSLAGYADPHMTATAFANRARDMGVEVLTGVEVTGITPGAVKTLTTTAGDFQAPTVILAAGPWMHNFARMLGTSFAFEVSRHKVITLKIDQPYHHDWPVVKDLTTPDKIYFRPETGGMVLLGTGDHGDPIEDPDTLTDDVDDAHIERMAALIANRMPSFVDAQVVAGWTGPYDITPDWNPVIDALPGHDNLYVAFGFSGHGFKLAPTLGEGLAMTVLGMTPRVPIEMYNWSRFEVGAPLHGAYGIGSIS